MLVLPLLFGELFGDGFSLSCGFEVVSIDGSCVLLFLHLCRLKTLERESWRERESEKDGVGRWEVGWRRRDG